MSDHAFVLIAGKKDDRFAEAVAAALEMPLCDVLFTEFDGGETKVQIRRNLRGREVYVLWSPARAPAELFVVLQLIDAAKLSAGARRVALVASELPFGRQDKSHERRECVSTRLLAKVLEAAGLDQVVAVDLHSDQTEAQFRIPLDHLRTRPIWAHYIAAWYRRRTASWGLAPEGADLVLGVPDAGRSRAVRELSDEVARHLRESERKIRLRLAFHDKQRSWEHPGQVDSYRLLGDVGGRVVWFSDDLLASGDTLFAAAKAAKAGGARAVICSATHAHGHDRPGQPFAERLVASGIDEMVVSDTNPLFLERVPNDPVLAERVTVLSLASFVGAALRRIQTGETVKEMVKDIEDHGTLYRVVHQATYRPLG